MRIEPIKMPPLKAVNRRGPGASALLALLLALPRPTGAAISVPDTSLLQDQDRIKRDSEEKIRKDILDPILGKDQAMVFVDVEMDVKIEREEKVKQGMGLAERYKEKLGGERSAGAQTMFVLPGIPKPKTIAGSGASAPEKPESVRAQQSQQSMGLQEERYSVVRVFKKMTVTVQHSQEVLKSSESVKNMRARIVEAMSQYQLKGDDVFFRPTPFIRTPPKHWSEDLRNPEVYIPLLFASLLFLLLLFLFGPLARFFRQYVEAIKEKPAAEINVESTIEPPEDKKGEEENPLGGEGSLDITMQRKAPEPPPDEDESMKKFEPFAYINEENIKRLVYMFMLRREEPWVIAVVVSYLRSDYARQVLTALPVNLQAKVAIEALTVRQITREQVTAIDAEVKESVDFVVGGMERLTGMLDEADSFTRNNILNYLKTEKPSIYEKVRKFILVFEDVVNFPDREMQIIVRELKTENMARALQNASPDIVNKFFSNMSTGAASLLKESMEYTKGLTPQQIDEERAKIMDQVKLMEKEGKVTVRQKPEEGIDMDTMQEEVSSSQSRRRQFSGGGRGAEGESSPPAAAAPAADPAQAQAYLDAGVAAHDGGQMAECVQYLEYALSQDPGLWQAHQYLGSALYQLGRTAEALAHYEKLLEINPDPQIREWVESFKAQVGG